MRNVQAMAASGYFIASRLPVIFLTLERNRQWWTTEPLLSSGTRVSFPGSKIVWEYYAGQGIEIQWLGTFGEANGYYLSGHENANLHQLLGEVLPLATQTRRRDRVGVHVPVRRRAPAVDERALAGHGAAGASRARGRASRNRRC